MTLFWVLAVAILVAALVVFCFPWQANGEVDRNTLNRIFYQSRLKELEREASGRDELMVELQRNLLADIPSQNVHASRPLNCGWLLPGVLGLVILSTGIFMKTSGIQQVSQLEQAERQFPALYQRAETADAKPLSLSEMATLSMGLRAHLQTHADFIAGWQMLGRLSMVLNDAATAKGAFERAYQLSPEDRKIAFDYASVLIRLGDREQVRQGELLTEDMLKSQPSSPALLELQALSAWRQERYSHAAELWQRVLNVLPADSPLHKSIQLNIDEAHRHMASGPDR